MVRAHNSNLKKEVDGAFAASDRPIFIIAANDGLWQRLCQAIGRPELGSDPRFNSVANRAANEPALTSELEQALAHHTAAHWEHVLTEAGVPCSQINTVQEAAALPQVAARNMIVSAGKIRMAGNPIKLSAFPDPLTREPAGTGCPRSAHPRRVQAARAFHDLI